MALEWHDRTASQLAVGLDHDLVKGIVGSFREAQAADYSARLSGAAYSSKTHSAFAAYLFLIQLHPGFRYDNPMTARKAFTNLGHLTELSATLGAPTWVTAGGRQYEILPFSFQDVKCFALASSWGSEDLEQAGAVTNALQGYMCNDRKVPMTTANIQALLSSIRVDK